MVLDDQPRATLRESLSFSFGKSEVGALTIFVPDLEVVEIRAVVQISNGPALSGLDGDMFHQLFVYLAHLTRR